jgi:surfeit locus 1 family protein
VNGRAVVVFVAALVGAGVTARLGFWQLDRAAQKTTLQAMLDSRRLMAPLPAAELATSESQARGQHYRPIVAEGTWLPEHTVFLDNRPMAGRVGFIVVTPLRLVDGSAVSVQRGWLPRDAAERTRVSPPLTPTGLVRVAGRIAPPPSRLFEFSGAASGPIRQNLDLGSFAAEVGLPLRPLSIVVEDGPLTAGDGLLRQWPAPATDVHKHFGYAFQWFAMATLVVVLYVWFQLIHPRRRV